MKEAQQRWRRRFLTVLLVLLALFSSLVMQPAVAAPLVAQNNASPITQILQRVQALLAPSSVQGRGAPAGRTKGGAGRGRLCPATSAPVSAFVPSIQSDRDSLPDRLAQVTAPEIVFGKTLEANPTFWFYIPYQSDEAVKTASFMLLDEQEAPVLPKPIFIPLPEAAEVIKFQLPYALSTNRLYNWYFTVLCDPFKPSRNPGVRGWIQRVEPSPALSASLQSIDPKFSYLAYAEQGIWFDMLDRLAKAYYSSPENPAYQQAWAEILKYLGLPDLSFFKSAL